MLRRLSVRAMALALTVVIGALTSGIPSHHHGRAGTSPALHDAGHHGHGVQLVEHAKRLKAELTLLAAFPAPHAVELALQPSEVAERIAPAPRPMIGSRAPPIAQPRAPPTFA